MLFALNIDKSLFKNAPSGEPLHRADVPTFCVILRMVMTMIVFTPDDTV